MRISRKKYRGVLLVFSVVVLGACSNKESLQRYYVDSAEKEGFINLDIPSSMLDISKADLTEAQREAYQSVKKQRSRFFFPVKEDNKEFSKRKKTKSIRSFPVVILKSSSGCPTKTKGPYSNTWEMKMP